MVLGHFLINPSADLHKITEGSFVTDAVSGVSFQVQARTQKETPAGIKDYFQMVVLNSDEVQERPVDSPTLVLTNSKEHDRLRGFYRQL